ncbi:hypothetical protein FUAX_17290 [Fulvitalea axinellae]|uniref:Leucine-rich repeat domain-containing protein n=1 Tax=Fulvitalea axinellae TaxID=1182444 RepID=A0AAU9CMZ3_9BACT|nr:hypothetical protein FUAX_17290 [Fulvitalea axinellae]
MRWEENFSSAEDNRIPLSAFQNPEARVLDVSGLQNPVFPEDIPEDCPIIRVVMKNCGLRTVPKVLTKLRRMILLYLEGNQLETFPEELAGCPSLSHLYLDQNPLRSFGGYDQIKSLTHLSIIETPCATRVEDLLSKRIVTITGFDWKTVGPPQKDFSRLASALAKSPLSEKEKRDLLLFAQTRRDIHLPLGTLEERIRCLCVRQRELNSRARELVLAREAEKLREKPLDKKATLLVAGKTSLKKSEIKGICGERDVKYVPKYSEAVTHVLLGDVPKELLGQKAEGLVFLSEGSFSAWADEERPQFIGQASNDLVENIKELLYSRQEENIALALEMMKAGGVPKVLYFPCLFLIKTHGGKAVNVLKKHLKTLLPEELQGVLKSRATITWTDLSPSQFNFKISEEQLRDAGSEKESEIVRKLEKNEEQWGVDFCLWYALEYFKNRGRGLRYLMTKVKPNHPLRTEAIDLLMKNGTLDWSKAYGYEGDWWSERQRNKNLPIPMPLEIVKKENVKELRLQFCRLHEMPEGINAFKNIRKLDLSKNGLKDLPNSISELSELEELDLSENSFRKFPKILLRMKTLRKVLFGKQSKHIYGKAFERIEVPAEVKELMPDCVFEFAENEK